MTGRHGLRALGFAAACVLLAAACQDDRADITDPVGRVYNARFAAAPSNLPRGFADQVRSGAAATHEIFIELKGLEALASGTYQVFLATQDPSGAALTNVVPATGTLTRIQVDTSINDQGDPEPDSSFVTTTGASSFSDAGTARVTFQLSVTQADLAAAGAANTDPNAYNLVMVAIQPGAAGTEPAAGAPIPLWARLGALAGTTNRSANFRFGNFAPDPANEYVFQAAGRGLAGVWDNLLVVDDSALSLPPKGYYYATVLTRLPDAAATDLQSIVLGPQKAPYPRRTVSLFDADINPDLDPVVVELPPSIQAASERVRIDTIAGASLATEQPFRLYRQVIVSLEPKQGVSTYSGSVVLAATLPDVVVKPPEE